MSSSYLHADNEWKANPSIAADGCDARLMDSGLIKVAFNYDGKNRGQLADILVRCESSATFYPGHKSDWLRVLNAVNLHFYDCGVEASDRRRQFFDVWVTLYGNRADSVIKVHHHSYGGILPESDG